MLPLSDGLRRARQIGFPALGRRLVTLDVDVMLRRPPPQAQAAQNATSRIAIVDGPTPATRCSSGLSPVLHGPGKIYRCDLACPRTGDQAPGIA